MRSHIRIRAMRIARDIHSISAVLVPAAITVHDHLAAILSLSAFIISSIILAFGDD